MRLAGAVLLAWLTLAPVGAVGALAQDTGTGSGSEADSDIRYDPETGAPFRVVRPPEGLRRGSIPVEAWVSILGGVLVLATSGGVILWRLRRRP